MLNDRDPSPDEVVRIWRNQAKLLDGRRGRKPSLAELALPRYLKERAEDRAETPPPSLTIRHPEYELVRELGPDVTGNYARFLTEFYRADRTEDANHAGGAAVRVPVTWRAQLLSFVISRRIRAFKAASRA